VLDTGNSRAQNIAFGRLWRRTDNKSAKLGGGTSAVDGDATCSHHPTVRRRFDHCLIPRSPEAGYRPRCKDTVMRIYSEMSNLTCAILIVSLADMSANSIDR
jgi:hypothetical protein